MDAQDIIVRPVVSEKTFDLASEGRYTFEVASRANKIQIREAIETLFNVHVTAVNTMWVQGKSRRMGRLKPGRTPKWKKAIVTLVAGESIPIFETG